MRRTHPVITSDPVPDDHGFSLPAPDRGGGFSVNAARRGLVWKGLHPGLVRQAVRERMDSGSGLEHPGAGGGLDDHRHGAGDGAGHRHGPLSLGQADQQCFAGHHPAHPGGDSGHHPGGRPGGGLRPAAMVSSIFEPGLVNMIIGHITFQIAFVALVVRSRLVAIGREVEEAARDLFASNWYLLRRVMLPLLMPGIIAGGMLAFTLSLDDFVISFFTAGPESQTLPLFIFRGRAAGGDPPDPRPVDPGHAGHGDPGGRSPSA
jgi:hypothetical protein